MNFIYVHIILLSLVLSSIVQAQEKITDIDGSNSNVYILNTNIEDTFYTISISFDGDYKVFKRLTDINQTQLISTGNTDLKWANYFIHGSQLIGVVNNKIVLLDIFTNKKMEFVLEHCINYSIASDIIHSDSTSVILQLYDWCLEKPVFYLINDNNDVSQVGIGQSQFMAKKGDYTVFLFETDQGTYEYYLENLKTKETDLFNSSKAMFPVYFQDEYLYLIKSSRLARINFKDNGLPIEMLSFEFMIDDKLITYVVKDDLFIKVEKKLYSYLTISVNSINTKDELITYFISVGAGLSVNINIKDFEFDLNENFLVLTLPSRILALNLKTLKSFTFIRSFFNVVDEDEMVLLTDNNKLIVKEPNGIKVMDLDGSLSFSFQFNEFEFSRITAVENDSLFLLLHDINYKLYEMQSINWASSQTLKLELLKKNDKGLDSRSKMLKTEDELLLINESDLYLLFDGNYKRLNTNPLANPSFVLMDPLTNIVYYGEASGNLIRFYKYQNYETTYLFEINSSFDIVKMQFIKDGLFLETKNSEILVYDMSSNKVAYYEIGNSKIGDLVETQQGLFFNWGNSIYKATSKKVEYIHHDLKFKNLFSCKNQLYYFSGEINRYDEASKKFKTLVGFGSLEGISNHNVYKVEEDIIIYFKRNDIYEYYKFDGSEVIELENTIVDYSYKIDKLNNIGKTSIHKVQESENSAKYKMFDTDKNRVEILKLERSEIIVDATLFNNDTLILVKNIGNNTINLLKVSDVYRNIEEICYNELSYFAVDRTRSILNFYNNFFLLNDQSVSQIDSSYNKIDLLGISLYPFNEQGATLQGEHIYYFGYNDINGCQVYRKHLGQVVDVENDHRSLSTIKIVPNPASNTLRFQGLETSKTINYQIRSITGQLVQTGNMDVNSSINIENLSNGLFTISVMNENIPTTYKFLISK